MISFDDFMNIDMRTAHVVTAERVEGSDKLMRLEVDLGDEGEGGGGGVRQIVAGIGKAYAPEDIVGKYIIVVANLEPRSLMGLKSEGMLLAARDADGRPVLVTPEDDVPPGVRIS